MKVLPAWCNSCLHSGKDFLNPRTVRPQTLKPTFGHLLLMKVVGRGQGVMHEDLPCASVICTPEHFGVQETLALFGRWDHYFWDDMILIVVTEQASLQARGSSLKAKSHVEHVLVRLAQTRAAGTIVWVAPQCLLHIGRTGRIAVGPVIFGRPLDKVTRGLP